MSNSNHNQTILLKEYQPVALHELKHPRILVQPKYFSLGVSPLPLVYARYAVLNRLFLALKRLPVDYGFIIWDCYQPWSIQWLLDNFHPAKPAANDYLFAPNGKSAYRDISFAEQKKYGPPLLSGGCLALTLFDTALQKELNLGTPFGENSPRAHTRYFETLPVISAKEQKFHAYRMLLQNTLEEVGFVSHPLKWWQFDFGNFNWSHAVNHPPLFKPMYGKKNGQNTPYALAK